MAWTKTGINWAVPTSPDHYRTLHYCLCNTKISAFSRLKQAQFDTRLIIIHPKHNQHTDHPSPTFYHLLLQPVDPSCPGHIRSEKEEAKTKQNMCVHMLTELLCQGWSWPFPVPTQCCTTLRAPFYITWRILLSSPLHSGWTQPRWSCRYVQCQAPKGRLGWGPSTKSKLTVALQTDRGKQNCTQT